MIHNFANLLSKLSEGSHSRVVMFQIYINGGLLNNKFDYFLVVNLRPSCYQFS